MNIIQINGTNLPDIFFQSVYKTIEVGRNFVIDRGSYEGQIRKEFDFVVLHAKCPHIGELIPKLNPALNLPDPVAEGYLDGYLPYLMTGEEKPGEAYTYGQRICSANADIIWRYTDFGLCLDELHELPENIQWCDEYGINRINQMELMIWTYKHKGYRNNQMIMQVGQPSDMSLKDPPCLRHIDTRIQDGQLHFFPYFRSWDLWGGLPANLAAIESMRQYCAKEIGLPIAGEIVATSKGLHLYDYVIPLAEAVRGKTSEEFRQEALI